ncbi:hypothetical protein ACUR5C_15055 [Aliikangiella sp. IMCC44653]
MRILLVIAYLFSFMASASTKNEIAFESGAKVRTCEKYNSLRASQRISETTSNMIIAAEYLECSLMSDLKQVDRPTEVIAPIGKELRIRSIPTSLGPQVDRMAVLSDKFVFDGHDSFKFSEGNHNIVLTLKGQIKSGEYLFWVFDEILDATYRAFFPLIIEVDGNNIKARPFYLSGF